MLKKFQRILEKSGGKYAELSGKMQVCAQCGVDTAGVIIDCPVSAFGIRRWRAVTDRPYKKILEICNPEDFS